jgi:ATP-dependent exoDNAse (exonuclease V) alpha subunit
MQQLALLRGESKCYLADANGDRELLSKLKIQQELHLKEGAPVMLLKNLGDRLYNGLIGDVVKMHEGAVEVKFPQIKEPVTITPHLFTW